MDRTLRKPAFEFYPLASIRPEGWLKQQLRIQADGLSGNLDLFWPDIADSRWIGGSCEGWERVPYWLDGFIPLAFLLDDPSLQTRAGHYIDKILEGQHEDGWICPCEFAERDTYDMWALFLLLKVLIVWHDATDDVRVEPAVERALRQLDRHIDTHTLFDWAQVRWYEALLGIFWLYRRQPGEWLLKLAWKLHSQGFDFPSLFDEWPYTRPNPKGQWSIMNHVVNQAMMLKGWSLFSLLSNQDEDRFAAEKMLQLLDRWHGMVNGMFTGDECMAGQSPVQGTELCAVVEMMFSLEHLSAISGDAKWGDRLEWVAFNALPATFSPDMWSHQYVQQVNQVECSTQDNPVFTTNKGQANLFGLEPNYGCCTANLSQGWPKFARSLFMCSESSGGAAEGIAVVAYAPATLSTSIGGVGIEIRMQTDYPFRDQIWLDVHVAEPVHFPLYLRIPGWSDRATVSIEGEVLTPMPGSYFAIDRDWSGEVRLCLHFPMGTNWQKRPNGMVALTRGPLVYSLAIAEKWCRINADLPGHELPHGDYELFATVPWQYAIDISNVVWEMQPIGGFPFSPDGAPVEAWVNGGPIDWPMSHGSATSTPLSRHALGRLRPLRLIPYGCTNLRLTEFPELEP